MPEAPARTSERATAPDTVRRRPDDEAATRRRPAREPAVRRRADGDPPSRRTVTIQGRADRAHAGWQADRRRRPARPTAERIGPRPDRIGLWVVVLSLFLVLVALASAHL